MTAERDLMKRSLILLVSAAVLMTSGCAEIGYTKPTTSDVPLRKWLQEVPSEGAFGTVTQTETEIVLTANRACDIRDQQTVRRTSTSDAVNRSAALDWLVAGLSALGVGTGTFLVVDAGNTYSSDKTSRTYNPVGADRERVYGIGLIAAGIAVAAIPLIDVIRAGETKVDTRDVIIDGQPNQRGVACSNRPLAGTAITGSAGERTFALGTTDPRGKLTVNLDQVIDRELVVRSATSMTILAGDNSLGAASLDPVRRVREERAWSLVDVKECQAASQLGACGTVERFVANYPDGIHGAQAQQLLEDAKPKLMALADNQAWRVINVGACTHQDYKWSNEVRAACEPLVRYLAAFPSGLHAKEARSAADSGSQRAEAIDQQLAREQKAQERRNAAEAKRQCVPRCFLGCSNNLDSRGCVAGCIALNCRDE